MELRREDIANVPLITGFAGRGFRVGEQIFENGLLVDPANATGWDAPSSVDLLEPEMLEALLNLQPEFLLLGTGPRLVRPSRAFVNAIEGRGIGIEAMDSRAAARAWGVLLQEERQVVAALLPHR